MAAAAGFDLPVKDKIVVVTGGGAGIGLAYVRIAHSKGAKVIIADLKLHQDGQDLANEPNIVFAKADVSKWADLENLITVSKEKFGDVPDVYVANAGVFEPPWSSFWEDSEKEEYAIMNINVNHPIKFTRIAIRSLLGANKQGVVCITASMAGYTGQYPAPLYSASKHAVVGFTRSMGPTQQIQGVKVVTICPGIVDTPLWNDNPKVADRFSVSKAISITADDVAQAIDGLIEDGKYVGGTILEISKNGTRVIPEWNIDPPQDLVGTEVPKEAMEKALGPIFQKTAAERGAAAA